MTPNQHPLQHGSAARALTLDGTASLTSPLDFFGTAPGDPIFDLTSRFKADPRNDQKVNLGVGIYLDGAGRQYSFESVDKAIDSVLKQRQATYLPIEGWPRFSSGAARLLLGEDSAAIQEDRVRVIQSLGGTGALALAARLFTQRYPQANVIASDPTWANHLGIFDDAGVKIEPYPYYDNIAHRVDFTRMMAAIEWNATFPDPCLVILHGCCHNPTGRDLSESEWDQLVDLFQVNKRKLLPLFDVAYQGFGAGIDRDAYGIRAMAEAGVPFFCAQSFSKAMGLYEERVGALTIVADSPTTADKLFGQAKLRARRMWSNPPAFGARVADELLNNPELRQSWEGEYASIRERITSMRSKFADRMEELGNSDFSHVRTGLGMFALLDLPRGAVERLISDHAVYLVRESGGYATRDMEGGRINFAGMNDSNLARVCSAIAAVSAAQSD